MTCSSADFTFTYTKYVRNSCVTCKNLGTSVCTVCTFCIISHISLTVCRRTFCTAAVRLFNSQVAGEAKLATGEERDYSGPQMVGLLYC